MERARITEGGGKKSTKNLNKSRGHFRACLYARGIELKVERDYKGALKCYCFVRNNLYLIVCIYIYKAFEARCWVFVFWLISGENCDNRYFLAQIYITQSGNPIFFNLFCF